MQKAQQGLPFPLISEPFKHKHHCWQVSVERKTYQSESKR